MASLSYKLILHAAQEGRCFYCGCRIGLSRNRRKTRLKATVDHVFPVSRPDLRCGPAALLRNKVLACQPCNGGKGNRPPTPEEVARLMELERIIELRHLMGRIAA